MSTKTIVQKGLPYIVAIVLFLIFNAFYFSSQLEGKVEKSHDILSARANLQEIKKHKEKTGETTLWTNTVFGGMPTYQIDSRQPSNLTKHVYNASNLWIGRPIGLFFASMLIFYLMMVLVGVNPWLSILGALAFGLTTNNYVLYGAGHITKIYAVIHLGLVTAGIILALRQKKFLLGGIIFAIGLSLDLLANHIQMSYYYFLAMGLYGIIELVYHIQKKEMASFGKAVLFLAVGGVLAIGANSGKLLTTYEYSHDTMRGKPILEAEAGAPTTSSNTDGLDYEYATRWSNGWMDLVAGFIPGVVGKGSVTYWGANEDGTAGPAYYGAIVFLLFILGLLTVRGPLKWGLLAGVVLISLISLGKHFFLHGLLYDTIPLFNKFRTPNSALSVVAFLLPILGIIGLDQIIKGEIGKKEALKALYIAGGTLASICLFYAVIGGSFFDFSYVKDAAYQQNYNINIDALRKQRIEMMTGDAWRSFLLIALATAALWAFLTDKIKTAPLLLILGVLTVGDLWLVNKEFLNEKNFVRASAYKKEISPRPVDTEILKDKDPNYRVFDLSNGLSGAVNSSQATNKTSYYHKNTGGYHPAKLQRYQDMLDRYILPEGQYFIGQLQQAKGMADIDKALVNMPIFNMMNTKYFIINNESPIPNTHAMGNAWFVNNIKVVNSPNEEVDALRTVNPSEVAIVNNEFNPSTTQFQKQGSISLTDYQPNHLTYKTTSNTPQFAVFSEVWYGPNKGWQAYIDGTEVDHIRTNYILRGLDIPAGDHTIEFKFEPQSYTIGYSLSLICSLLILLSIIGYVFLQWKNKEA